MAQGQMEEGITAHFTGSCAPWLGSARRGCLEAGPGLGTQPRPENLSQGRQGPARPSGWPGQLASSPPCQGVLGGLGPDLWPPLLDRKVCPLSLCPGEGSLSAQGHRKRPGPWWEGTQTHHGDKHVGSGMMAVTPTSLRGGGAWCSGAARRCLGGLLVCLEEASSLASLDLCAAQGPGPPKDHRPGLSS